MRTQRFNHLKFLCFSTLILFVIVLAVAWGGRLLTNSEMMRIFGTGGLPPVSSPAIDLVLCGPNVIHYTPTGVSMSFDGSYSYDPDGWITEYYWSFGDGSAYRSTSSGTWHSYASPGHYYPNLTVTDNAGASDDSDPQLSNSKSGHVIAFKAEILSASDSQFDPHSGSTATIHYQVLPTTNFTPTSVTLKIKQGGTAIRSITLPSTTGQQQISWDGRDSNGVLVSGGSYDATIELVAGGKTATSNAHQIRVLSPPVADAGADQVIPNLTDTVSFDGSGSHDPDGGDIASYTWNFGADASPATSTSTTQSTASCTYSTSGKKTVTLTVTDEEGNQASATCTVVVSPPVARISADQVVAINTSISFDGSGSHDPDDGTGSGQGITAWSWSFPGGTPASATSSSASTTYNTPGIKTVSLTVTDNDTPALEATATLTVNVVSIQPQTVNDGDRAEFTLLGDTGAVAWSWGWNAPAGAGNSPSVTFSPSNMRTTSVPNAKWFALPDRACKISDQEPAASLSCVYTITCDITFPTTSFTATSSLTVNVPWSTAGEVRPGFAGTLKTTYNNATQLWEVTGLGSLERVIRKTIFIPPSSQFYNPTDIHEQVHYEQLDTGIASSYYTLNDLWQNHLQGLGAQTKGILGIRVRNKIRDFLKAEDERITPLIPRMEADAYRVSDQISPQYVYRNCGRYP